MATCHGCSTSFGFLSKEVGCPCCGFSYCKKCLRFKVSENEAQELGKMSAKSAVKKGALICRSCHDRVSSKSGKGSSPQLKDAANLIRTLQRLESVESKPPITLYQPAPAKFSDLKSGLSEADQKIVERLEELRSDVKNKRKSDQSDSDVEARLARLRGEDPDVAANSGSKEILLKQKPETEADLLNRLGHEVKLNKNYDDSLVRDIEERLAKLRPGPQPTVPLNPPSEDSNAPLDSILDSDDDEGLTEPEQVQKLINKFVAEVALEAKTSQSQEGGSKSVDQDNQEAMETESASSDEGDDIDDDYCELCNENRAVLKCKSCDGDSFCKKCFHEFHVELGEIHKPTPL